MESGQRLNQMLRQQRRLRGWSQDDVAAGLHRLAATLYQPELGVDAAMVGRWERGTRRPRARYVRLLCDLFELPAEQLGIVEESPVVAPPEHPEGTDGKGQGLAGPIRALLARAGLAAPDPEPADGEPWERLAAALRRPARLDGNAIGHLERITAALESLEPTSVGPAVLLGPVMAHLDALKLLLRGSLLPALRARVCSLAGETAGLAGWLRWDLDDPTGAAAYFQTGLEAAREAGDRPLAAYLVGSAACQPPHREDPGARLRRLHDAGLGSGRGDATAATRVWLVAKEADACALLGDADGCLRALERAETVLRCEDDAGEVRRPRFSIVDETWLAGERGASLARLGRTSEARAILDPTLANPRPGRDRDRLLLRAALADTYVRDAEPEEACRLAGLALEGASRIHLEPVVRLVEQLCRNLAPYRETAAVRDLDERLRACLSTRATG